MHGILKLHEVNTNKLEQCFARGRYRLYSDVAKQVIKSSLLKNRYLSTYYVGTFSFFVVSKR